MASKRSKRSKHDADSTIMVKTNGNNGAAATVMIHGKHIESLPHSGLDAFHRAENATAECNECKLLQDEIKQKDMEIEQKDMEIDRLRSAEEKSSTSLEVSHVECSRNSAREELRLTIAQR